ncbi:MULTISPECIES: Crp/Fnr family transcriptional regulator [Chryseobacterium]|uniref:CRP-like cAMP-binding protein n=1 Tax=Chryseobacterium camelliae TaxID=1265445 RepID=A0ABU0TIH6_9FLAO|nr:MULTISPECIES: Crp/Fnr family transcriptional regulator [Chryseobacterium]MDT3409275.1 CRP-like cAMP-binding protein [Pseudacidovorax intermedius]MDQ1096862.1 CRP-like cAMP-binding protein [Chryseobacterium camelliae]MDQ1100804.1 CRP-like cAMP-binding protein [Chryseobacterium sp. SORGH_AS_1048]MDR6084246.1 CRP-like cAMP-binding protein [Chryseobacterium sp. SORGH_AS_0909]MDR6132518.1 CRP-like cAMP-binding protein [Chryseobacterium sp. SORGH_AS_1175]
MNDTFRNHLCEIIDLTDAEYELIKGYYSSFRFRKHQFVIQENQHVDYMYFVSEGLLKCSLTDALGKEHILQFACKNWWISDFQAYFKQEPSTLSVQCLSDSELIGISYQDMEALHLQFPKMEHFFRVKSNFGYIALQKRIVSLMSHSARERYDAFLNQYPDLVQKISKQLLANYLGVSRETLSRLQM